MAGLHKELLYITEDDKVFFPFLSSIQRFYILGPRSIYAIIGYEGCGKVNHCECLETRIVEVSLKYLVLFYNQLKFVIFKRFYC